MPVKNAMVMAMVGDERDFKGLRCPQLCAA